MSSATLYRWSGIALLVGSLLGVIGSIMDAVLYPGHSQSAQQMLSTPFLLDASLFLAWALLLVFGLPGLYLRQTTHAGKLGFVGFVLLLLGVLMGGVAFAGIQVIVFPYLAQTAPKLLSGGSLPFAAFLLLILGPILLLAIGNVLLGIATMRAGIFPRWAGILLIIAGVLFLLSITPIPFVDLASNLIFFVALVWCGYLLMGQKWEVTGIEARLTTEAGASQ